MTFFKRLSTSTAGCALLILPNIAHAQMSGDAPHVHSHASDHAPIGVMAEHRHAAGEWMLSYRYMHMDMDGSRDGNDSLSATDIVTHYANPFFGATGQPPTYRVVPQAMTMDMHMIGGMYGLTDNITLMAMTSYIEKDMDHTTYMGSTGTTELGTFNVNTTGFGDTTLGAIIGLKGDVSSPRQINASLAFSLPTGSIDQTSQILTPMNTTPTVRVPYAMQLGTGTIDFKPGVTYTAREGHIGWGAQASARLPLGDNDEGYRYGNRVAATAWMSYEPKIGVSLSARLSASSQGDIEGSDAAIALPVQTADPDNYGGEQIFGHIGVNLLGQIGAVKGHRLAFEYGVPIRRDLNGPQMETDQTLTLAWQKAF